MATQKKEKIKVRDLKPKKDAKGGMAGKRITGMRGDAGEGRAPQVARGNG